MVNLNKVYSKDETVNRVQQNIQVSLTQLQNQIQPISNSTLSGASTATLTNSPVAGDPDIYLQITINGVVYLLPAWEKP